MANTGTILRSIAGRQFGLGFQKELLSNGKQISRPAVDATVTVSDEGATTANVRDITIQLLDADGKDIDYIELVEILIVDSADLTTLAAPSPSTGLATDGDGALMQVVQHNLYLASSETDGDIALKWTDTGTAAAFIHVRLPSGAWVSGSQALTNA